VDYKVLDSQIIYYQNLIQDTDSFIDLINNDLQSDQSFLSQWNDWYSSSKKDHLFGKKKIGSFSNILKYCDVNSNTFIIGKTIKDLVDTTIANYQEQTGRHAGYLPDSFDINKYNPEAYMGPHVDSEDDKDYLKPSTSMVIYLNDDYRGGEISFPNQKILLKPTAGSAIIFPSYQPYLHDPRPVISGYKYMSSLFWFKEKFW